MKMKSFFIIMVFLIAVVILTFSAAYPNAGLLNTTLSNTRLNGSQQVVFLKTTSIHMQVAGKDYKNETSKEIDLKEKLSTTLSNHTKPILQYKRHAIGEEENTKGLQNQWAEMKKSNREQKDKFFKLNTLQELLEAKTLLEAEKPNKEGKIRSEELKKLREIVRNTRSDVGKNTAELFVKQNENKEETLEGLNKQAAIATENATAEDKQVKGEKKLAINETRQTERSKKYKSYNTKNYNENQVKQFEATEEYSETKLYEGSKNQKGDVSKQRKLLLFLRKQAQLVDKNDDSVKKLPEIKTKGLEKQKREIKNQAGRQIKQHEKEEQAAGMGKTDGKEQTPAKKEGKPSDNDVKLNAKMEGKLVSGFVKESGVVGEQAKEVGTNPAVIEKLAKVGVKLSEESREIVKEVKNKKGGLNKPIGKENKVKRLGEPAGKDAKLAKTEMKPAGGMKQQKGVHTVDFGKQSRGELEKLAERKEKLAGDVDKSLKEEIKPSELKKQTDEKQ